MRLFVAIDPPGDLKQRVYDAAEPLRALGLPVRWSAPEALHVTLKFLGEVRPRDVDRVRAAMLEAAAKTQPFETVVRTFGAFPSLRRPRVIWAGLDATPGLRCLKHDLEWEYKSLGFDREMRAFQPHITLARVQPDAAAGAFRDFSGRAGELDFEAPLRVDGVRLIRSHLGAAGARYEVLSDAALGHAAAGAG